MNGWDIVLLVLLAVAIGWAVCRCVQQKKRGNSCCCGNGGCSQNCIGCSMAQKQKHS